ncbi:chloride channel protein [bacterium]|nr:chloride channel protein [candidate division CSSED10-310 bacterium]
MNYGGIRFQMNRMFFGMVDYFKLHANTYTILLSAVIGVLGGFGAIGFRMLINLVQDITVGAGENVIDTLLQTPWYMKILIPTIGGAIVGPMIFFLVKEAKGHGVPEVMEAVALHSGRMRARVVLGKAVASAITIGTGGSVGREGPIVQIGSAAGSTLGQMLKLSPQLVRTLVGCGAAAGIAATFNAPIAGVLFAVEIILGNFALHTFSPLVVSSVLATVISRHYLGNHPAFNVPHYVLNSPLELPLYLIVGIILGFMSVLFSRSVYKVEDIFDAWKFPNYLKTPVGMTGLGIILCIFPQMFGVGYETITHTINGNLSLTLLLLLIPVKIFSTSLSLGCGGSGGVFVPTLFIGALTGGAFGKIANILFPTFTASSGAYGIVGMGAMLAAATHAPVTAIIIIFELTGDYKIILPLMFACIVSTLVSKTIHKESIYTEKLSRRGINLDLGLESTIMTQHTVGELMHIDVPTIRPDMLFRELFNMVVNSNQMDYHVTDDDGVFLGSISMYQIVGIMQDKGLDCSITAKDIMRRSQPRIGRDATLMDTIKQFSIHAVEEMPVVSPGDGRIVGIITHQDIFALYNREILRQGTLGLRFITKSFGEPRSDYVNIPKDYKVILVPVVNELVDRSVAELDLRKRFSVSIVAIRPTHGGDTGNEIPVPDRVLTRRDVLIVVGPNVGLSRMKEAFKLP